MTYKVWIEIEHHKGEDEWENYEDLRFASSGEFETEREAVEFAERLHLLAEALQKGGHLEN